MDESLARTSHKLAGASGVVGTTKELMDLELARPTLTEIATPGTLQNFLNSLRNVPGDYARFVRHFPGFALLRLATTGDDLPLTPTETQAAIQQLVAATKALSAYSSDGQTSAAAPVDDMSIVESLTVFTTQMSKLSESEAPPAPTGCISVFRAVEETLFSEYHRFWLTTHALSVSFVNRERQHTLEVWLMAHHFRRIGATVSPPMPSVADLAQDLVSNNRALFASTVSQSSHLIIGRRQAALVIEDISGRPPEEDGGPTLTFTNEILASAAGEFVLLYAYVIEALCHGETYGCTEDNVNRFLRRGMNFLKSIGATVEVRCVGKRHLSDQDIVSLRDHFVTTGLTSEICSEFQALLLLTPPDAAARNTKLGDFMRVLRHITSFGSYFYQGLSQYSPTSLSFRRNSEMLNAAALEDEDISTGSSAFPWTLSSALMFLRPLPPRNTLTRIYTRLPSYVARSLFSIWSESNWDFIAFPDERPVAIPGEGPVPAPRDVAAYCKTLSVVTVEEDPTMTRNPEFAAQFVITQLYPGLVKILSNELQRNRAIVLLRWLIMFAADSATGLQALRRPLLAAYFQIVAILGQRGSPSAVLATQESLAETLRYIRQVVPDANFPADFIATLYTATAGPLDARLSSALVRAVNEIEITLNGFRHLCRVGYALCHGVYLCDPDKQVVEIDVEGTSPGPIMTVNDFSEMILAVDRITRELLVSAANLGKDLRSHHAEAARAADTERAISQHPLAPSTLEPNIAATQMRFIACFRRLNTLNIAASESCCFNLRSYFSTLFEPPLIPLKIAQEVLQFSDQSTDLGVFVSSFAQPTQPRIADGADLRGRALNSGDLFLIRDLYPEFPTEGGPTVQGSVSIKRAYTDSFDNTTVTIDPVTFNTVDYEAGPPLSTTEALTAITAAKLDDQFRAQ